MKKVFCLVFAFLLIFSLAACQSTPPSTSTDVSTGNSSSAATTTPNAEKTELSFMLWDEGTNQPEVTIGKQIIDKFNAENKFNVTIVPELIPSEQTKTKLPTLMAANTAPDIFNAWAAGYLAPYVKAGKVYSLQEALDADPAWKASFLDGIMDYLTYDGKVYAIPTTVSTQVAYYNKEIFDKYGLSIPNTQAELVAALEKIRDSGDGIIPMAFANKDAWPSGSHSEILANRIGGSDPFNKASTGEGKFTDPSFIQAAGLLKEMVDKKLVPDGFSGMGAAEAVAQFKSGKAASFIWSSYCLTDMESDDSAVKGKVVLAKCPTVDGGKGDPNMWLGQPDRNFVISESCKNKEAAVAFIKYYTSAANQQLLANKGTLTTIKSDLLDMTSVPDLSGQLMKLHKDMTGLFVFYDVVLGPVTGNEYNNTVQAIMAGDDAKVGFERYQQFFDQNKEAE
ncbi:MAG: ABC transporter substrate-binding protein [Ruminiclostridium sp.]